MAPLPDFSGPLTATALAFRLAAADPTPCDIGTIRVDTRPVFTAGGPQIVGSSSPLTVVAVGTIPRPGAPPHRSEHGHGHPHVTGSRTVASTPGAVIDYVLVPDHTEHTKDATSDRIINEALKIAAEQPVYFPPRVQW